MGFKRTNEGRVFFAGANDEGDQAPVQSGNARLKPKKTTKSQAPSVRADATQGQIITLLKTLNERLKLTQSDRDRMAKELETTRASLEELEEKSARNERIALDLEHRFEREGKKGDEETLKQLAQTRAHLAKLEKAQKAQGSAVSEKLTKTATHYAALTRRVQDTETKQTDLDQRVETATAQQAKLMRKVDKAIEDRARFMRKIERIEETVLQTRDSLNAKAMVLLTDQDVPAAAAEAAQQISATEAGLQDPTILAAIKKNMQAEDDAQAGVYQTAAQPREQKEKASWIIAGTVAVILVVCGLGLILINTMQSQQDATIQTANQDKFSDLGLETAGWQPVETQQSTPNQSQLDVPGAIESYDWTIETSEPQVAENDPVDAVVQETIKDTATETTDITDNDVGAIDLQNEEQVAALLADDPQAVAAQLNAIEPQRAPEAAATKPNAVTPKAEIVAAAPAEKPAAQETGFTPAKSESVLRSLIKPDTKLPNVVKVIEDQAFTGIAEAQHDLAAVYTAGHGGVTQNYDRAAFWFERAAENGIANAGYNLGVLYHQGLGFDPNVDAAMTWYKKAAEQGHPEAQYNLGIAYIEGIGVKYDPVRASTYFENAAQGGVMEAAYNLGLIYENGLLGAAKPEEALIWYKNAADRGSPEALQALKDLAKTLQIDINDVNRIAESMRAAEQATRNVAPEATNTEGQNGLASSVLLKNDGSNQTLVAQIQDYLMKSGLYPGPADGVNGPLTEDAIRSYQSFNGLTANGKISQNLLSHMLANDTELGSRAN